MVRRIVLKRGPSVELRNDVVYEGRQALTIDSARFHGLFIDGQVTYDFNTDDIPILSAKWINPLAGSQLRAPGSRRGARMASGSVLHWRRCHHRSYGWFFHRQRAFE